MKTEPKIGVSQHYTTVLHHHGDGLSIALARNYITPEQRARGMHNVIALAAAPRCDQDG